MSLLGNLFSEIKGSAKIEHPCDNCPSNCEMYPDACDICKPYKEKILDALYGVEHKNEIAAKYEVVGDMQPSSGTITCPHCGGASENHYVCDYCGSKLQEGSGKIQVKSAADIPNPVLDCQNLIFERYDKVSAYDASTGDMKDALETIYNLRTKGLLGTILSAVNEVKSAEGVIGSKMSEYEIAEMASLYGVSESVYLAGLDNGKYLTKSAKLAYDKAKAYEEQSKAIKMSTLNAAGMAIGRMMTARPMQQRPTNMCSQSSRPPMHNSPMRGGVSRSIRRPSSGRNPMGGRRGPGGPHGGMSF